MIWIADARRDNGKRVVHADEKLTAFTELEAAIHEFAVDAMLESLTNKKCRNDA